MGRQGRGWLLVLASGLLLFPGHRLTPGSRLGFSCLGNCPRFFPAVTLNKPWGFFPHLIGQQSPQLPISSPPPLLFCYFPWEAHGPWSVSLLLPSHPIGPPWAPAWPRRGPNPFLCPASFHIGGPRPRLWSPFLLFLFKITQARKCSSPCAERKFVDNINYLYI